MFEILDFEHWGKSLGSLLDALSARDATMPLHSNMQLTVVTFLNTCKDHYGCAVRLCHDMDST